MQKVRNYDTALWFLLTLPPAPTGSPNFVIIVQNRYSTCTGGGATTQPTSVRERFVIKDAIILNLQEAVTGLFGPFLRVNHHSQAHDYFSCTKESHRKWCGSGNEARFHIGFLFLLGGGDFMEIAKSFKGGGA